MYRSFVCGSQETSLRRAHCRRQPEGCISGYAVKPRRGSLLHATGVGLVFLLAVTAGYEVLAIDLADEIPSSSVSWVCPKEPFEAAVGKSRFYRHAFITHDGLVRATARWWIDDWGLVHVDGNKIPAAKNTVETPVDLTAALAKAGRHVLAVEGKNMVGLGGVCLSIALEYACGSISVGYE